MSSQQSSAALTGSLLANKGAAAPSNSVSAFLEEFPAAKELEETAPSIAPVIEAGTVCAINPLSDVQPDQAHSGTKARAKLSLRLDPERHLKLKLAAAHLRRSSQAIMLDALDAYLTTVTTAMNKDCHCLGDDG